ncbi:unnamed protein product [Closterium sp. NIES-54]
MASLCVLTFDHEGRLIQFDTWLDDLQLYLLSDSRDGVSLFDHTSGASLTPPTTADSAPRSQWLTRDAAARLAIRNHLPLAKCAHFGQHKTSKALYDAVVAHYSSLATSALGRLLLPYLFPELSAFATVEDLNTHLRTSDARYRAALVVEDHFLALDPTDLTVDLLEQHLLAAETSVVAVGDARGTPGTPFVEGCSPSPLAPSYASATTVDVLGAEDVGATSASGKRRSSKGKGGRSSGGGSGGGSGGSNGGGGASGVGGSNGSGGGIGGFGGGAGGSGGSGSSGGSVSVGSGGGAVQWAGSGGGQRQQQKQRRSETPSPQQLREWFSQRGVSGGSVSCPYVIRTSDRAGQTCGKPHTQHRCFSCLDDAWRAEFGDEAEHPRLAELLRSGVATFDLDYDAILAAMYALFVSAEGDCYLCVPPNPGIEAAALGATESALPGTAPAEALRTFIFDSSASHCFFRDRGPVLARSSTVLPYLAVPSGSLLGLHLPSFSTNLVNTATLHDAMVTTTTLGGQRVSICTCTRTSRHLATFTRRPGSSLYTLATEPRQVAASAQVSASGPVAPPCSCRLLSHQTLLWHHRLGHPSLPRLRGMHSRLLVSGLPRSLPLLPPLPIPPCLPCVEGPQSAAPHSSSFPPTTAPLQTLHMNVWGPPRVSGQGRECYFLLVVDDYTRYTTVFPLHSKGEVPDVLIPWIRAVRLQLRERFHQDLPTMRWTGEVGDASVFRVWGSHAFVRDTSADKFSARAIPCDVTFDESAPFYHLFPYMSAPLPPPPLFLAPGPPSVDPLPRQGRAPSGVSHVDPVEPVEVAIDSDAAGGGATRGAASGGAEPAGAGPGGTAPACTEPGVAESEGAEPRDAEPEYAEPGGAELGGAEPKRAEPGVPSLSVLSLGVLCLLEVLWVPCRGGSLSLYHSCASGLLGAPAFGVALLEPGGPATGGTGARAAGGTGGAGPGGARTGGTRAAGAGGVAAVGAGDTGAGGAGPGGTGAVGAGSRDTGRPRPYFVPLLQQVLGLPSSTGLTPPLLRPPHDQSQPPLQPASHCLLLLLTLRRPEVLQSVVSLCLVLPRLFVLFALVVVFLVSVLILSPARTIWYFVLPLFHSMSPCRLLLRSHWLTDRTLSLTYFVLLVLLATVIIDPSLESTAASAFVAELIDFATACRLDYATSLVAESESVCPPSIRGECALCTDVLGDKQEDFECFAAAVPHLTAMDAEMASWKSTGTYVVVVPPPGANIVDGMWIFIVKRSPSSPPAFKARYVARGFIQRQGVDFFHTFSPTPKMTTLWELLHVAAQRDHELHSLDFSTAFLHGSLHEEIWLRRLPGFTGSFPAGTQWSLRRPVYGLREAPREWHNTLRTTLAALGFASSTADPSLFLRTDTSLPPFYVLVYIDDLVFAIADTDAMTLVKSELQKRHTCTDLGELSFSASASDDSVEPSGLYPELVGCLMYLMTCTRPDLAYPLSILACYVAPGRQRPEHWEASKRVLCYLCNTLGMGFMLGGRGPVVLAGHADASWPSTPARPAAHSASGPCCPARQLAPLPSAPCLAESRRPALPSRAAQAEPRRPDRAALPILSRAALPHSPAPPSRPAAATAAVGSSGGAGGAAGSAGGTGGAVESARGAAGSARGATGSVGGAGGTTGSAGGAATDCHCLSWSCLGGGGFCFMGTAQQRQQRPQGTLSLQRLHDCASQRRVSGSLGASASTAPGPASAEALHTFTLDSGASRCFFRDCTTVTPLAAPVPVSMADPTGGPVVAVHSRLLVSGLPSSLPPLSRSPALPCLPCVEGRQRAAPHSSEFPPTTAPLQTLHMDEWGPALVSGTDQERYFLLVVDDYTRYTIVFSLQRKADVSSVLIPWIRATRRQLRERFQRNLPVLRLHSDRGGELSSDLLKEFCQDEGIRQTFTLPASPQQNGIAERRIGLIMDARTSMIHAAAPHFLWPFAVRYAAHQLNLWPCVSEPETSPTLLWTGKVGDASVFRVWGAISLVCDAKASKLSSRTLRCAFLGFPTDAPPWQFYHPRSRRVFSSQDVTFDESVCFYRLHPHASHPGPAPSGVSQVDPPPLDEPVEITSDSSGPAEGGDPAADDTVATRRSPCLETAPVAAGGDIGGEGSGGAETEGEGSRGAATGGADYGGFVSPSGGGAVGDPAGGSPGGGGYGPAGAGAASPGGAAGARGAGGAASAGGTAGGAGGAARAGGTRGAVGAGGAGATSPGGTGGVGSAGGAGATSRGGATSAGGATAASLGGPAGAGGAGATGTGGAGAAGAGGAGGAAGAGGAGAGGTGGAGAAGPGGARTRGAGAAVASGAAGARGARGAAGVARGTGAAGTGGASSSGAGATGAAGPGGARTRGTRAAGARGTIGAAGTGGAGAAGAGGARGAAGTGGARAGGTGGTGAADGMGTAPRRPFFYPQPQSSLPLPDSALRQVLSLPSSTGLTPPLLCPPTDQSQPQLQPGSPPPALAPHNEVTKSLTERGEPETRASTPVCAHRVARPRPPAVPGTHGTALCPSSIPHRVVQCEPPTSSLPHVPDPESDLARTASPTVTRLLATVVTDPDFESTAAFALVIELVEFAARSRLDYVASLVTESESVYPPSVGGEPVLGKMTSWKSTYVDKVTPPGANIVDGMWMFRVKQLPGSPPAFKARYLARGFSQQQGVGYFRTFSPTPKMTTLWVLLHVAAQRDYKLHSFDFSTTFLQGSLHEEIWLRRPPGFIGSFPAGTQWSLRRPVYGLRQAPREWHDTLRTTLAALGFAPSSADPSLFLRTDTALPLFYVLMYVDDLVFATADTEALALVKAELQERHTCTDLGELRSYLGLQITWDRARRTITLTQSHMVHQVLRRFGFQYSSPQPTPLPTGHSLLTPPLDESVEPNGPVLRYLCSTSSMGLVLGGQGLVVLTGHSDASWADDQATQRSSQGYTFSLGSGSVSWRSTRSSSVLGSCYEAEIYAGVMAAQELRWLTYLLTDLGELPRSPPVLYVDNKAMLALCREQRLEHRTKHIALRYFLARELQQRGQLRLSYVASRANTADVFTKALGSGDLQRFCSAIGLVPTLPHLLVS